MGAFHFYWRCSALGKVPTVETIENWSLKICHLSFKEHRHDTSRTVRSTVFGAALRWEKFQRLKRLKIGH
jgi:hypothetical protein